MKLKDIQKEMEIGQLVPNRMAELRTILAGKYSRARDEWDRYETLRVQFITQDHPSMAKGEALFQATDNGEAWRKWKSDMKKCEKMLSSLKTQLEVATQEAYNTM